MAAFKHTVNHFFFSIVSTLRDYHRISVKKDRNRAAVKAAAAALIEPARLLIADQTDDGVLKEWARSSVVSGSAALMNCFPERSHGALTAAGGTREDWTTSLINADADFLKACQSRGVALETCEKDLVRVALQRGDKDLQNVLLKILAPYSGTVAWAQFCSDDLLEAHGDFICSYLHHSVTRNPQAALVALSVAASRGNGAIYAVLRLMGVDIVAAKAIHPAGRSRISSVSNHRWISAVGPHTDPKEFLADPVRRTEANRIFIGSR